MKNQPIHNKNHTRKTATIISLLTAILLAVGCFRLPIGYYTFLRIFVFVASIVWIVLLWERELTAAVIVTALLCILFNPIIPVYLHNKTTWIVIDALAAIWFICLSFFHTQLKIKSDF